MATTKKKEEKKKKKEELRSPKKEGKVRKSGGLYTILQSLQINLGSLMTWQIAFDLFASLCFSEAVGFVVDQKKLEHAILQLFTLIGGGGEEGKLRWSCHDFTVVAD
jgi:hypothetical protein